jgi:excisionase family DNA binding protein
MPDDRKIMTLGEVAEYLRVHRSTIYRLVKRQQLPGFRIGSDWRFDIAAIDQWRLRQSAKVESAPPVRKRQAS